MIAKTLMMETEACERDIAAEIKKEAVELMQQGKTFSKWDLISLAAIGPGTAPALAASVTYV